MGFKFMSRMQRLNTKQRSSRNGNRLRFCRNGRNDCHWSWNDIMANVSSYDVISACEITWSHYLVTRFPTITTQEKYMHE